MENYSLKFEADTASGEQTLRFHEKSVSGALEFAKESARGDWAELYRNEKLICRMRLVSETGVWLVGGMEPKD